MEKDFLKGNHRIEEALEEFLADKTQKNLIKALETIRQRINEKGHFLIPAVISDEMKKKLSEHKASGDKQMRLSGDELHFAIRKHSTKEGKTVFAVFTGAQEAGKGEKTSMISDSIGRFLSKAAETEDVDGVVINPWGCSFFLSKENINKIFEVDAKVKQQLGEGFKNAMQSEE